MTSFVAIDHFYRAPGGMCDEDATASSVEHAVIERAADRRRYFDHSCGFQRHEDLTSSRGGVCLRTGTWNPSMCNPPGKCRALHRAWTASRLAGSLLFPRIHKLAATVSNRKACLGSHGSIFRSVRIRPFACMLDRFTRRQN